MGGGLGIVGSEREWNEVMDSAVIDLSSASNSGIIGELRNLSFYFFSIVTYFSVSPRL